MPGFLPERQLGIYELTDNWLYFIGRYRSASYWVDKYQQTTQTRFNIRLIRHTYELNGLRDKTIYLTHDWFETAVNHEIVNLIEDWYAISNNLNLLPYSKLKELINVRI